jgi:hypothetical protein
MSNERYNEYHTEVLKNTLNAQVTQNLSMQAMALVNKEIITDLQKQVEELQSLNNSDVITNLKKELLEKQKTIDELKLQLKKETVDNKNSKPKKAIELNSSPPKVASTETTLDDGGTF